MLKSYVMTDILCGLGFSLPKEINLINQEREWAA
jgi:hypothetical protein